MSTYHSQTAYWYGYQAAITGKPKPITKNHQSDVDMGYADGKQDLHRQMLEAFSVGTVQ